MDRIDVLMKIFIATFGAFLRVLFWRMGYNIESSSYHGSYRLYHRSIRSRR